MLAGLGRAIVPFAILYVWCCVSAICAMRGQLGALFAFDLYSVMALRRVGADRRGGAGARGVRHAGCRLGNLFRAAMLLMLAGSLYRFDTYLVAFRPGAHWSYFPSVGEILVTLGLSSARSCSTSSSSSCSRSSHWRSDHVANHH